MLEDLGVLGVFGLGTSQNRPYFSGVQKWGNLSGFIFRFGMCVDSLGRK